MIKLYLDFDGVILDTIDKTYEFMKKNNIVEPEDINSYYLNLNWDDLINNDCEQINDSITNIKKLLDSKLFDISILTHVNSSNEANAKINYLHKMLGNIEVIPVDYNLNKCDVVDCKNTILVDDYIVNLDKWFEKGGIPVKFSDSGKQCNYLSITRLDDLLNKYNEIKAMQSL